MSKSPRQRPVIYDPDPTDMQMRALEQLRPQELKPDDLTNPQVVGLLIHYHQVNLTQLKRAEDQNERLRNENNVLQTEREELRIKIAILESQMNANWLEIPISLLSGVSINLLTNNPEDGMGWLLLIISLVMLLYIRGNDLLNVINRFRGKSGGENNG